jgi:hypothetical protein
MDYTDEPPPLTAVTQQLNELLSEFQASVAAAQRYETRLYPSKAAASAAASSHLCVGAVAAEDSLIASSFEDMQGRERCVEHCTRSPFIIAG